MRRKWLIILYFIGCVVCGAASDALSDGGMKVLGHLVNATEILLLLAGAVGFRIQLKELVPFIATYVAFRIVFFDPVYNVIRGLPLFYLGSTGLWDKFLSKFPAHGVTFMRVIFLMVGIAIPIKEL